MVDSICWVNKPLENGGKELVGTYQVAGKRIKVTVTGSGDELQKKMDKVIASLGTSAIALVGHEIQLAKEGFSNPDKALITNLATREVKPLKDYSVDSPLYRACHQMISIWNANFIPPTGMYNGGNWCYVNSSLQLLFNSKAYFSKISQFQREKARYPEFLECRDPMALMNFLGYELKEGETIAGFSDSNGIHPNICDAKGESDEEKIVNALKFQIRFRLAALELHEVYLKGEKIGEKRKNLVNLMKGAGAFEKDFVPTHQQDANAFVRPYLKLLGLGFKLTEERSAGEFRSSNQEYTPTIQLGEGTDLQAMIAAFEREEIDDMREAWMPDDQFFSRYSITRTMTSPPDNIWLSLKRPYSATKKTVEVPDTVVISGANYRLKGFQKHAGSERGGHYTSYLFREGTWYHCNDSSVQAVEEKNVPKGTGYIYMFEKIPEVVLP